jgi:uncharacterized protein (TIGR02271 family)
VGSVDDERGGPEGDLRVQRSEEELRAGVREREAGRVNVRKSVHTERELVRVPKRREEVEIERVPVEGEAREASRATEADIGEDEVVLQVFEEEVVVTKRVVLKEEIRIRKRVAWDEHRRYRARLGGAVNPVRALGPMLVAGDLTSVWLYIFGPIIGGVLAAFFYERTMARH